MNGCVVEGLAAYLLLSMGLDLKLSAAHCTVTAKDWHYQLIKSLSFFIGTVFTVSSWAPRPWMLPRDCDRILRFLLISMNLTREAVHVFGRKLLISSWAPPPWRLSRDCERIPGFRWIPMNLTRGAVQASGRIGKGSQDSNGYQRISTAEPCRPLVGSF